ncbi:pannexin 8 [Plakobranchus ocellatus]|uniref:Innexin n=1 Tax=Plakobranchus ocellatus TaxID=259542 RepID=A0AAV3YBC1_9GAST|nr:pannexin 8 [Plakobranchus ocellatus]
MAVPRRSLAQDSVVYYTLTVSVPFFLLLSLVTWLLPLNPDLQPQTLQTAEIRSAEHRGRAHLVQSVPSLNYEAQCWCPSQFTHNMVEYTNAVCGAAFNLRIQGIDPATRNLGVSLYDISFSDLIPVSAGDHKDKEFMPRVSNETQSETPTINIQTPTQKESSEFLRLKQEKTDKAWHFIHVKTPFVLFLFAICLTIPHLVWILMSGLVGGVNVDKTLLSAMSAGRLDYDSRRRLYNELAHAAGESMRACSWVASALYLLLKLLVCAAVLAELFVVHGSLLPQAKSVGDDLKLMPRSDATILANNANDALKNCSNTPKPTQDMGYSHKLLLCTMQIRMLQNIQTFTLQCIFNPETSTSFLPFSDQNGSRKEAAVTQARVWEVYEALYLIVQTCLVLVAVVNVVSLLEWLVKLVAGPCRRKRLSPNLPADACLLLYMADQNAGPEVARVFAQSGAWGRGEGKENIALNE